MKIAITTTDGVHVNQHFGKADEFHVYELNGEQLTLIEKRNVDAYCATAATGPVDHEFDGDRFSKVYSTINDCGVLYTRQIGETPEAKLRTRGMDVQQCSCSIESIISCGGNCKSGDD